MADELIPEPTRRQRRRRSDGDRSPAKHAALVVFALLVTLGPLAFGAVDRVVQIALTGLLGIGMLLVPPRVILMSAWISRALLALTALVVLKEVAPAGWFGAVGWRTTVEQSFGLALPWTHHPEAGRAFDGWLAGAVAVGWFAWVRTLAAEREDRMRLAWVMLIGAALIAAVSFGTATSTESKMILGLRYSSGWIGFGPFPNRNHSACYFAMAAILGAGCVARSGEHRRFVWLALGALMLGGVLLALLRTQSRGGIVALGAGFAIFLGIVLLKLRSRKVLAVAVASALLIGGLGLLAGGKTLQRIAGTGQAMDESASARVAIWKNAATMWHDAPLLGHGLGAFASVFPVYQQIALEEVTVKHPESSWLQWLTELGLVPVLLGALAALGFALPNLTSLFERQSGFFIRAAAFGAVAALLAHAVFDVPAHRWGTAGFALAALALACPASSEGPRAPRLAALVPLGVAGF
ncbi:MAG: O-antigen ligase family protein, partial [Chthoniobacteraceae bacterium]